MDIPDGLSDPNGPAFTKSEYREGPPLSYVAEKLRTCVESLHLLHASLGQHGASGTREQAFACALAFRQGLLSYLALQNLLGLLDDEAALERLLRMSSSEFKRWLDHIDAEGSLT